MGVLLPIADCSGGGGGTLVVAGGVGDGGAIDAYLAGYDTDGTRRWQGRWGSTNVDLFAGVEPDGRGYLCAGLTGWSQSDGDARVAPVQSP